MIRRHLVLSLAVVVALGALGPSVCNQRAPVVQEVLQIAGYVEPNTPGSGAPEEFPTPARVTELLGDDVDLNRINYVRSALENPPGAPRAVLVLIPGFLGGATTFDPVARDLVRAFGGNLEVWAIDRRPNQLEDRLGAIHAVAGADEPDCLVSPPLPDCPIFEGAQFYSPDLDLIPQGNFPGPEDKDVNLNGVFDPQLALPDDLGATRLPILYTQDELRFLAHWGVDTYMRDWKMLVDRARALVGPGGVVLLGGHSQGTTWATTFAAYDFDPDPAVVDAGHAAIDGLVLLEGGGVGSGSSSKPSLQEYLDRVADLETPGCAEEPCDDDVFLNDFFGVSLRDLGTSGEVASVAAFFQPTEPSLIQRTPVFTSGTLALLLSTPSTNRAVVGLFLDDDFSGIAAFRASFGFTDNGPNLLTAIPALGIGDFYLTTSPPGGGLRTWKDFDDPTLPTCPPNVANVSPGCAILDNGPPSGPGEPPRLNGVEAEVTSVDDFANTQFGKTNGFEWYFVDGRVSLDFSYGNDSSALVAEALAADPTDEGPLRITQQAGVDVPVIAIGGSNGLTPEAKSFDRYFGSIATPAEDRTALIVEGYAHLDVINARDNGAVPPIVDFINQQIQRKLLESF
ncbi:MAG: hypothetical protein QNK04_19305 [Myxococcota bacterium]|nr:hypothetical protein [Myxococcota bacterium]